MQTTSIAGLLPVLIFLVLALGLAIAARRRSRAAGEGGFVKEYFIGNRTLGGFVLAMTTIATYGSVSSFVGGPGQAWQTGFGWVYMAAVQVTTLFLLYGIMGKKMALVSRKLGAVTVIDVIRARFRSNALANAAALIIVLFFAATMVAQFVGGAKLFEAVTGYSYFVGLAIFGVAVIIFTTVGGFRGVAVTDALCGIAMLVGIVVLAAGILIAGGGWENIMGTIRTNHPQMLEPFRRHHARVVVLHAVAARWHFHVRAAPIGGALHGLQRYEEPARRDDRWHHYYRCHDDWALPRSACFPRACLRGTWPRMAEALTILFREPLWKPCRHGLPALRLLALLPHRFLRCLSLLIASSSPLSKTCGCIMRR